MRKLRYSLIFLFLSLILLLVAIPQSEFVLRHAVSLIDRFSSADITVAEIKTDFPGKLEIQDLYYHHAGKTLKIDTLTMDWRPLRLFIAQLRVNSLEVTDLSFNTTASHERESKHEHEDEDDSTAKQTSDQTERSLSFLPRPWRIHVGDAVMDNITLNNTKLDHFAFAGKVNHQLFDLSSLRLVMNQFQLRGEGTFSLYDPFDIHAALQWRVNTQVPLSGFANIKGDTQAITLHSEFSPAVAATPLTLDATLFSPLDAPHWTAALTAQDFDFSLLSPNLPGTLTLAINSEGEINNDQHRYYIEISELHGQLEEALISGGGRLDAHNDQYDFSELHLAIGETMLSLDGAIRDEWSLRWQVVSDDLRALWPSLHGALDANGQIRGARAQPRYTAAITANHVSFEAYGVDSLDTELTFSRAVDAPIEIRLEATNITQPVVDIETLSLNAQGSAQDHHATLRVDTAQQQLQLGITGQWDNTAWEGNITALSLSGPLTEQWALRAPSRLHIEPDYIMLELLCLDRTDINETGELCAAGEWQGGFTTQGALHGTALPLAPLYYFLPSEAQLTGEWDFDAKWEITEYGTHTRNTAAFDLRIAPGTLSLPWSIDKHPLAFGGGKLAIQWEDADLHGDLHLILQGEDTLQAEIDLPGFQLPIGAFDQQPLQANAQAQINHVAILALLFPNIDNLEGSLSLNVAAEGTLRQPKANGTLRLQNVQMDIPTSGIQLTDTHADIDFSGGDIQIDLHTTSGEGTMQIRGEANIAKQTGNLIIQGENFLAMDTPGLHLVLSPDLQLVLADGRLDLSGDVHVPQANITSEVTTGFVAPSSDVIIVGEAAPPPPLWEKIDYYGQIRLLLGDQVKVDAFGLKARIEGDLTINESPGRVATGTGELRVVDGIYRAYERELEISTGRLMFAEGPLTNPNIDVRAIRQLTTADRTSTFADHDITVGIQVTGSVQTPMITLFSEPTMPESDILSYLVFGRPLAQTNDEDANQLTQLATAIGLQRGGAIARDIGQRVGLDDVSVDSDNDALTIGKRLSPRLYISYGIGLFEPVNIVRLRYQISRHFEARSETGVESAGDIFYTIETN